VILPVTGIKCASRFDRQTGRAQHKLPAVYPFPYIAAVGGLIAYGHTTSTVAPLIMSTRILKGAKPAELPLQVPTK
jgi:putative ABC transport system substrate-binding protein